MTTPEFSRSPHLDLLDASSLEEARTNLGTVIRSGNPSLFQFKRAPSRYVVDGYFVIIEGDTGWDDYADGVRKAANLGVSNCPTVVREWRYSDGSAYAFGIQGGSYFEVTSVDEILTISLQARMDCYQEMALLAQHGLLLDAPEGEYIFYRLRNSERLLILDDWDKVREGSPEELDNFRNNLRIALAILPEELN